MVKALNEAGAQGWELKAVCEGGGSEGIPTFLVMTR